MDRPLSAGTIERRRRSGVRPARSKHPADMPAAPPQWRIAPTPPFPSMTKVRSPRRYGGKWSNSLGRDRGFPQPKQSGRASVKFDPPPTAPTAPSPKKAGVEVPPIGNPRERCRSTDHDRASTRLPVLHRTCRSHHETEQGKPACTTARHTKGRQRRRGPETSCWTMQAPSKAPSRIWCGPWRRSGRSIASRGSILRSSRRCRRGGAARSECLLVPWPAAPTFADAQSSCPASPGPIAGEACRWRHCRRHASGRQEPVPACGSPRDPDANPWRLLYSHLIVSGSDLRYVINGIPLSKI